MSTEDLCVYLGRFSEVSKVILLFVSSPTTQPYQLRIKSGKKVVLYSMHLPLWLWNIASPFVTFFICLKENPDIVQVNFRSVFGESLAAKLLNKKIISYLRVILIDRNNLLSFIFVNHIIGVSNAVIARAKVLGWKKGSSEILNGIDLERINLADFPDKHVDKNKIYYLSRLVRWKRPGMFIEAAQQIHQEYGETSFAIFGEGPKKTIISSIIDQTNTSGFIKQMGWVDHFGQEVSPYGIYILTSYEEPFGRSVVEAIIRGKVIITPNSGSMPEILSGYDLLFERDNLSDLVLKIRLAYHQFDKYKNTILNIRESFIQRYNMERVSQQCLDTYKLVMSKNNN